MYGRDGKRIRINLGNGQVWYSPTPLSVAEHIAMAHRLSGHAFVEVYQPGSADAPGEWFPL